MPQYDDRDIVGAIRVLRDLMCETNELLIDEAKKEKKEKLEKLGKNIKKIELTRR